MGFKEEADARELHKALSEHLARVLPEEFTVELSIFGVHCHCEIRFRRRRSVAHCFGHEYYIHFDRESEGASEADGPAESRFQTEARGRTPRQREVLDAVGVWLRGTTIAELYRAFSFVDRTKRSLVALEAQVLELRPGLQDVTHELQHDMADIYYMWFRSPERSCRVSYYGKNVHPDAVIRWDDCALFEFRATDPERLAAVLERWLCADEPPSTMRREFPWLEIGKLADYYEAGKPVEGEFLQSWEWIEEFFREHGPPGNDAAWQFVAALRAAGYDKRLRAGQSLWSFIVSRSRRHGLRNGQPHIVFEFCDGGLRMQVWDSAEEVRLPEARLTPAVDAALKRLANEAID